MSDLSCSECRRPLDQPACGLVHALVRFQILAVREFVAQFQAAASRPGIPQSVLAQYAALPPNCRTRLLAADFPLGTQPRTETPSE